MFEAAISGYSTDNIEVTKEFYSQKLGLTLEDNMGGGISFNVGGQQVLIYPKENHQPATYTVLNFVVVGIDAAVDELTSRGITFERYDNMPAAQDERGILRGKESHMGPDIAWFKDPGGNILAVIEK